MAAAENPIRKLGELLVIEGDLPAEAIPKILELQKAYQQTRGHMLFGQICVEKNLISRDRLQQVLKKYDKSIPLGQLMLLMGFLSAEALTKALARQKKEPEIKLGEILTSSQLITETQLVTALSLQRDIPVIKPEVEQLDINLLRGLDPQFVLKQAFLPLRRDQHQLVLAMEDPLDHKLQTTLKNHFQLRLVPVLASAREIRAALKSCYQREIERVRQLHEAARQPDVRSESPPPITADNPSDSPFSKLSLYEDESPTNQETGEPEAKYEADSPFRTLSLYEDDSPATAATAATTPLQIHMTPEPPPPPATESSAPTPFAEPSPPLKETLIVGTTSLSSADGQQRQEEGMLNYLIRNALIDRASAIHIEPQDKYLRVRYRINGVLQQRTALPQNLGTPMLIRLKEVCQLDSENNQTPQHHRLQARFNEEEFELSIATCPGTLGESVVLQIRSRQNTYASEWLNLEKIGFSPLYLQRLQQALAQPGGLVFITGPQRSGKTTTGYAAVNALNLLSHAIVSVENPVEHLMSGMTQMRWDPDGSLSFADLIRTTPHLDPDIVLISETESPESLTAAIEVALTGTKIITACPSFDTIGALLRLMSQGLEQYLMASGQLTLLSQRLVRKLCPDCRFSDKPSPRLLDFLGLRYIDPEAFPLWWPRGCEACQQTGYKGQTALHEILICTENLREALLTGQSAGQLRKWVWQEGKIISLAEDGYYKATQGLTSLTEVQRVASRSAQTRKWTAETLCQACHGDESVFEPPKSGGKIL
jgi:type II secretory ATPase GspE/PulE/Tfp pilus assembly ATPase PilB-like protein